MKNSFYGVLKAKKGGLKMVEKKHKFGVIPSTQAHVTPQFSLSRSSSRPCGQARVRDIAGRNSSTINGCSKNNLYPAQMLARRVGVTLVWKHCGMTSGGVSGMTSAARGFTLIELLVVVLIIGILAAVALPQYQFAVTKTRIKTYLPVLADMASANELYYLANGRYAAYNEVEDLDITMPPSCTHFNGLNAWKCDTDFMIDSSNQKGFALHYCPKSNSSFNTCTSNPNLILYIVKYYNNSSNSAMAGKWGCDSYSTLGTKLCNSLLD